MDAQAESNIGKIAALSAYVSSESEDEDSIDSVTGEKKKHLHLQPIEKNNFRSIIPISAAPEVTSKYDIENRLLIDKTKKELLYNPTVEDLYGPDVGPENPYKSQQQKALKNTLTGFVEPENLSYFHFEAQRRTFNQFGYANDPTVGSNVMIGDKNKAEESENRLIFQDNTPRPGDKRKRDRNDDSSDVNGYKGPWAPFVDEERISVPSEEDKKQMEEFLAKSNKKVHKGQVEAKSIEEKTILHIKDPFDYQGRSFLHPPQDVGVNLKSKEPPLKCFIPKHLIHTWTGHTKGISTIRWFPRSAHLILSTSMDSKAKLWEVYNERRCVRTYLGHKQAIKDSCFTNDGFKFLTAGYDRFIKLWDTETGDCISKFVSRKVPYCITIHPDADKQHFFVAGTSDKKILCWDMRSGDVVQEYDRHLGAVNSITFIDQNRRFVSTSDDKSVRVWEWNIPVDFKYIADPTLHSMPSTTLSPNGKWLACQSMNNQICIFNVLNRMKLMRKKVFKGHMVAGYACAVDFSPEMSYLVSGDADGKVFVWDWKTTKLYNHWKAHEDVCSAVLWHPHETSKLASAGWDGVIKFWD